MDQTTAPDVRRMFTDVSDVGTYGCFEYQGISVGLHSDEPALLDWFARFFGGYFAVTTNSRTDAAVYSSCDPAVFSRLKELAVSHGHPRSEEETEYEVDAQHRVIYSREVDEAKGKVEENCFLLSRADRSVLVSAPGGLKDRQKTVKRS